MNTPATIFWSSAALLLYTYAVYPLVVAVLARLRAPINPPPLDDHDLADVTVLIAAHNEAKRLADKIGNLLAQDYPAQRLTILVVSDGSTDDTARVAGEHPNVRVLVSPQRKGKACALNLGMAAVTSDIVVFCDVRQQLDPRALRFLVSDLADPRVGAVSGELMHRNPQTSAAESIGLYWRYEKFIRKAESRLHSTPGATGALYAMRRHDWFPLRPGTILDDFETPMRVVRSGTRVLLESRAVAWDELQSDAQGERRRKIRTLGGNYQSFVANPWLFLPWRNPLWWQFMSHKVLRLLAPYALLGCFAASLLGTAPYLRIALLLQLVFYAAASIGYFLPRARSSRAVSFAHVFCDMNLAAVVALFRYATGKLDARWEKA